MSAPPRQIRLAGIDCPEKGQPFGTKAKQFTADLVFRKTVRVDPIGTDRYGRTIATIYVNGTNVNHELVRAGMAWWYRKYAPNDHTLEKQENEARQAKRGLWADPKAIPPWQWRRTHRAR